MTNQKNTKRALLMSALALLMCVSMLVGTTFAWFTDTASTSVNQINSGKLKVDLVDVEGNSLDGQIINFTDVDGNSDILWEPGCTYSLPAVYVKNSGNLALKYVVKISGINGDAKLNEAIEWTITNAGEGVLEAGATSAAITITGHMKEDAGNEYQGLSINGIAIVVYATQANVENDMNGNDYDADAQLPSIWDGNTVTAPVADDDGVYHIDNAAEFVSYINQVNSTSVNAFKYAKVVLDCDIDLNNRVIEVAGEAYAFGGEFDGQGYTVSNYVIKRTDDSLYWTALFPQLSNIASGVSSVKNLNVENATVIGNGMVSAVVGAVYAGTVVDNCHATNCTVIANKKVGAVVGYSGGIVSNCTAKNSDVYCEVSRDTLSEGLIQAAEVIGYDAGTSSSISSENVNVYFSTVCVFNATELKTTISSIGKNESLNVVLMNDIDANNAWETIVVSNRSLTFDGNGHTIKNLNKPFLHLYGGTFKISNLTVEDSIVTANSGNLGAGVIVDEAQWANFYMDNCHVKNCKLTGGDTRAAALLGYWVGGGEIKNSTVDNFTAFANGSVAGVVGHRTSESGYVADAKITDCTVKNSNISAKEDGWRIGTAIGTVAGDNTAITNFTESANTLEQIKNNSTAETNPNHSVYGRISGGALTIDGISQ